MRKKKLLIIGLVWPEPTSSAAGWRMLQLVSLYQELGCEVTFVSAAQKSERSFDFGSINVSTYAIELNKPSFDLFIKELSPDLVMFDRFITEEQFGWRVAEQVPNAIRILDGEDFHGLRKARELALKSDRELTLQDLQNDTTKREIVAMYRCDLTLVISEKEILKFSELFKFPDFLMLYVPFLYEDTGLTNTNDLSDFNSRKHFMTVGNFKHPPNADAVRYLKEMVWPMIKKQLPNAELHIYGAYEPNAAKSYENLKEGFFIKGAVPDIRKIMSQYKVCLAPLRFGAGLKGKLFDAMETGTPAVMSTIAAEGLFKDQSTHDSIVDDPILFADKAVELYSSKKLWETNQLQGYQVLKSRFNRERFKESLKDKLEHIISNIDAHREQNFTGQLFQQQTLHAARYLSKWIEAKNQ